MEKGADSSPVKKAGDISISGQQQRFGPCRCSFFVGDSQNSEFSNMGKTIQRLHKKEDDLHMKMQIIFLICCQPCQPDAQISFLIKTVL